MDSVHPGTLTNVGAQRSSPTTARAGGTMGSVRLFGVTALSLAALTACVGAVVGGGGSSGAGGSTGTDTTADAGADATTDAADAADATTDGGPGACWICACLTGADAGGCADTCDAIGSIPPGSSIFCYGMPAMSMCKACIAKRCGVSDPTQCK